MTGHDMIDGGTFDLGNHSRELGQSEQAYKQTPSPWHPSLSRLMATWADGIAKAEASTLLSEQNRQDRSSVSGSNALHTQSKRCSPTVK